MRVDLGDHKPEFLRLQSVHQPREKTTRAGHTMISKTRIDILAWETSKNGPGLSPQSQSQLWTTTSEQWKEKHREA